MRSRQAARKRRGLWGRPGKPEPLPNTLGTSGSGSPPLPALGQCAAAPTETAVYGAAAQRDRLAARYQLGRTPVQVGGRSWSVLGPADPDSLIDSLPPNDDDRLPYWAQLWPAGQVLAAAILTTDALAGQRVLELGCGLGLTAAAALVAGADLLAVDCESDALAFAADNAQALAGVSLVTKLGNWRSADPCTWLEPPYDVILAADVLYEQRDVVPLAALVPRLLGPGGWLWLAEPRREAGGRFVELLGEAGWSDAVQAVPFDDRGQRLVVDLHRLTPPPG